MNESCHAYESVMSHLWMRHVTNIEMSHVTHMNQSCHTYDESCHTYKCVFTHIEEWCHTHECIFTHTEDSCHTYECVFADFKESYHTNEGVVSLTHEWLISNTWRGHINGSCQTHEEVTSYIWISHVTHQNHTHECTRWEGLWDSVTDLEIGYNTAKYRSTKVELLFSATISTGLHKVAKTLRAMQEANGKDASLASTFWIWEPCRLPSVDTMRFAASIQTFPSRRALHKSSSQLAGACKALQRFHESNLVRGDYLKSLPHRVE